MFVVDTNILVYAADDQSSFYKPCRAALDKWHQQSDAWYITWSICFEFLRVVTHRRGPRNSWPVTEAWSFIRNLLQAPALRVLTPTEQHAAIIEEVFAMMPFLSGNNVHDANIAILMREHGVRTIYTRDMGFHRFPFLEVIDPTA